MKEQHQKEIVKRLLRYLRKNHTEAHKKYAASLSSGKAGHIGRLIGEVETWGRMVRYMEGIIRELDEALEVNAPVVEETLEEITDEQVD